MPGDVFAGQKIHRNISASEWSRMRDKLARTDQPPGFLVPDGGESASDCIVNVANRTGESFAPGEVVALDAPAFEAVQDEDAIRRNLHFNAAVPTDDFAGAFGVLLNGLRPDGCAPAQVSGIVWAKLNMQAETDKFADIEADKKILKSGGSGAAQILWAYPKGASYPQETVGYLRLGNRSSSSRQWLDFRGPTVRIDGTATLTSLVKQDSSKRMLRFPASRGDAASFGIEHDPDEQTVDNGNFTVREAGCYLFSLTTQIKTFSGWPTATNSVTTSTDSGHSHTVTVPKSPMPKGRVALIFQYLEGSSWLTFPDVHQLLVAIPADDPSDTWHSGAVLFTANLEKDRKFRIRATLAGAASNAEAELTGTFFFCERLGDLATEA